MRKADFVLAAAAFIAAGGLYGGFYLKNNGKGGTAVIYVDKEPIARLSLKNDIAYTVEAGGGYNIVEIENGSVSVSGADCRDKICVGHKSINKTNESIICLPHKMVVEIEDGESSSVDAIAQ
ncbi:MAG: NusG domain II-containing protein [Firmicutes bacterium]|nr:NusG domain II-containing protein [Bacillota bacterium]